MVKNEITKIFIFPFFQLLDTKTSDKKMTLLHFIVQTVREKFPDLSTFDTELRYIEKAASGKRFLQYVPVEGYLFDKVYHGKLYFFAYASTLTVW